MVPLLPRIFLWTDKENVEDFFHLDAVNEDLYEILCELKTEPQLENIEEVKLLNEVYYQATRIVYEHPLPDDLPRYVADIKANLGWNFGAELVLTIVYHLLLLIDKPARPINKFYINLIKDKLYRSIYWKPLKHWFEKLKKEKIYLTYTFKPCPYPANEIRFKYVIQWGLITNDYELGLIEHVLNLWENYEDKAIVANMIETTLMTRVKASDYVLKRDQVHRFFTTYLSEKKYKQRQEDVEVNLSEELNKKEKIILDLQERISMLESSNKNLQIAIDSLIPDEGLNIRSFTLPDIVAYCMKKAEWRDVSSIVAMLNKLMISDATEEEIKMVDGIEEMFINRAHGNTYNVAEMKKFENVGTYNDKVTEQNNNYPAPQLGGTQQKKIEK